MGWSTTKQQLQFLHEVEQLDRERVGCLTVSGKWTMERARLIERQCVDRGWVLSTPLDYDGTRILYLTSRGLRLLQRSRARVQFNLPLGRAAP